MKRKKTYLIIVAVIILLLAVWELWDFLSTKNMDKASEELYSVAIKEAISVNSLTDKMYVSISMGEFKNPINGKEISKNVKKTLEDKFRKEVTILEIGSIEQAYSNYKKYIKDNNISEMTFIYIQVEDITKIEKNKFTIKLKEIVNGNIEYISEKYCEYKKGKWEIKEINRDLM